MISVGVKTSSVIIAVGSGAGSTRVHCRKKNIPAKIRKTTRRIVTQVFMFNLFKTGGSWSQVEHQDSNPAHLEVIELSFLHSSRYHIGHLIPADN